MKRNVDLTSNNQFSRNPVGWHFIEDFIEIDFSSGISRVRRYMFRSLIQKALHIIPVPDYYYDKKLFHCGNSSQRSKIREQVESRIICDCCGRPLSNVLPWKKRYGGTLCFSCEYRLSVTYDEIPLSRFWIKQKSPYFEIFTAGGNRSDNLPFARFIY